MTPKKITRAQVIAHLKSGGSISTGHLPVIGLSMGGWLRYAQYAPSDARKFERNTLRVLELREAGTPDRDICAMIKGGTL